MLWRVRKTVLFKASEHLGVTSLSGKRIKNPKKSAIFDHILLNGHDTSFENFSLEIKQQI